MCACACAVYDTVHILIQWVMTALLCVHVCARACAVNDTVLHSNTVGHDSITVCVCMCCV